MHILKNTTGLCCCILLLIYPQISSANGFRLPEYTAAGVATANALVADTSRIGAIAYNPAIMSIYPPAINNNQTTSLLSTNLVHIKYNTEVSTSSKTTQGTGQSTFDIPGFFLAEQLSSKLSIGVLIHSPFGLETEWPTATFDSFGGVAALEPKLSRIRMFNTNFNVGYRLDARTGIALGLNRYRLSDLQFNSHATVIRGSGTGYGWNAAFITRWDGLSFGASYRSAVHARATGTAASVVPIEVDITFPEILTIGFKYHINAALSFELDIEHTGWKVYDNLNIRKQADDSTLTLSTNNWKNTLTYRISGQYKFNKHRYLFGYAYDETPQDDAYFSARIPGADRQLFSIGYQYNFGSYQFDAGIMRVVFKDRVFNASKSYVTASDANGTTAYNGTYRSNATVLSVGVSTTF